MNWILTKFLIPNGGEKGRKQIEKKTRYQPWACSVTITSNACIIQEPSTNTNKSKPTRASNRWINMQPKTNDVIGNSKNKKKKEVNSMNKTCNNHLFILIIGEKWN